MGQFYSQNGLKVGSICEIGWHIWAFKAALVWKSLDGLKNFDSGVRQNFVALIAVDVCNNDDARQAISSGLAVDYARLLDVAENIARKTQLLLQPLHVWK